ncbi:MAG TPA: AraC family transcriptional regulator [Ktedonobacterales bacterium]|nr:AraC family transcriptional regulator [Ktedonobacterales bacterium]
MDVLSDTLRVVRLTGAVFLNAKLISPWAILTATPDKIARYLRLPSDCIALFHILVRGRGWFTVPGHAPILLETGDAILLPHSSPHVMSSGLGATPVPMLSVLPPLPPEGFVEVGASSLGEMSQFVCGFLHCDQRFNPLLGALPETIVTQVCLDGQKAETTSNGNDLPSSMRLSIQPGDLLETTLRHAVEEALSKRPGNTDMLARLSEILFVEMVRRYMQQLPPSQHGWLAAVRDPIVGQALRLLHARPEQAWTVETLADAVAVARSTLAQRFTTLVGETPMRYLATWRMQLAKYLLKQTNMNLVEIARQVGYESDVAFNHAFKRYVGLPPATWRASGDDQ